MYIGSTLQGDDQWSQSSLMWTGRQRLSVTWLYGMRTDGVNEILLNHITELDKLVET
jgi:hypothetical protein